MPTNLEPLQQVDTKYIKTNIKTIQGVGENLYKDESYIHNDKTRILITAKSLVLNAEESVYKKYCTETSSESKSIKELVFACDQLTIDAACKMPSTEVKIFARKLSFTNNGLIDTSGVSAFGEEPSINKKDGKDGYSAGNVHLYFKELSLAERKDKYIIAKGDKGQNGYSGKDGADGKNCTRFNGEVAHLHDLEDLCNYIRARGDWNNNDVSKIKEKVGWDKYRQSVKGHYCIRSAHINVPNASGLADKYFNKGDNNKPTNGEDAEAPGKPGKGGNGGALYLNIASTEPIAKKIKDVFDGSAGEPGKPTPDRKGGSSGQPWQTVVATFNLKGIINWDCDITTKDELTVKPGKDAPGKSNVAGEPGKLQAVENPSHWLHPALANMMIKWMKDQYLQLKTEGLKELLQEYFDAFNDPSWSKITADHWKGNRHIIFSAAQDAVSEMLSKLKNGVDFYGNRLGFMPTFSVLAAKTVYEKVLDDALYTIILTKAIQDTFDKKEDQREVLFKFIEGKSAEMEERRKKIKNSWEKLDKLETTVLELNNEITEKQGALNGRKDYVRAKARGQEAKIRMIDTVFSGVSLACKVIPFGQPALGLVGGTMTDIMKDVVDKSIDPSKSDIAIDWNKGNQLSGVWDAYNIYVRDNKKTYKDDLAKEDLLKQMKALNDGKPDSGVKENPEIRKKRADIKDKLERMDKQRALVKQGLSKGKEIFNNLKVDEAKLEIIYQKLLEEDPDSQQLVQDIKKLNKKLALACQKIEKASGVIGEAEAFILNTTNKISYLIDNQIESEMPFNEGVMNVLSDFRQEAYERICFFQYLFIKAYEAAFLRAFTKSFASQAFIDGLHKTLEQYKHNSNDFFDNIKKIKDAVKALVLTHSNFNYDDYKTAFTEATIGRKQNTTLRFGGLREGKENLYLATINSSIAKAVKDKEVKRMSLSFPISYFRDESLLSDYIDTKLCEIKLQELAFKFVDEQGNPVLDSKGNLLIDTRSSESSGKTSLSDGGESFSIERGSCVFTLQAPRRGVVRTDKYYGYVFYTEDDWVWSWEYDFVDGAKPSDKQLNIGQSTAGAIINDIDNTASRIDKDKILSPIPFEGEYRLTLGCPFLNLTVHSNDNKLIKVRPQIHTLSFELAFYAKTNYEQGRKKSAV